MKNNIILILAIISLLACNESPFSQTKVKQASSRVAALPYYQEATFTPHWFSSDSDSLKQFHRTFPFKLVNQNGDTITEQTFANKIYITDFFFTACPGICPKMTKNMGVLQDAFLDDSDVLLLSHSVTPRYDSVSVLRQYADANGVVDDKWHLVTGEQEEIYGLGRNAYFVEENLGLEKDPDDFLHTENFVLVDSKRHIRGIYNGLNKTSVRQLIADVRTLQKK
ncbi:MAG: SCO family protein [Bacteroidota bacterium]